MDFYKIIETKGYRRQDLSKESQKIMKVLDFLNEDITLEMIDYNEDFSDNKTIIGKLRHEIAEEVIEKVQEFISDWKTEYQVALAEQE